MSAIVGIDLGSDSLKGVEVEATRSKKVLKAYSVGKALATAKDSEQFLDISHASEQLRDFYKNSNFSTISVSVALPEGKVFTRVITMPHMSPKEVGKAIKWEAQQYIPMDISEVNFDFQILEESKESMKLLLVAAPKEVVSKLVGIVEQAGLEPLGVETTTQALAHLVQLKSRNGACMVLHTGSSSTDLGVVQGGLVRFTRNLSFSGNALARAISESLKIPLSQAEEYKRSYGLEDKSLEGKITKSCDPLLHVLVTEIKRSFDFYTSKGYGDTIERVILSGGVANTPGIVRYLAEKVGLEIELVDPFRGVTFSEKVDQRELDDLGPSLALSTGLALGKYE